MNAKHLMIISVCLIVLIVSCAPRTSVTVKDPVSPVMETIGRFQGGEVYQVVDRQYGVICYVSVSYGTYGSGTGISCLNRNIP
jgi:hypothetical protein